MSCIGGQACDTNPTACLQGVTSCATATCVDSTTPRAAGTACGLNQICNGTGGCNSCNAGAVCATGNPCASGAISCSTGVPVCSQTFFPQGTACGTSSVCSAAGACQWTDASLSGLTVSPGAIVFSANILQYDLLVPTGTPTVSLTASVANPTRVVVRVDGNVVASGSAINVPLAASGLTSIQVRVEAESGATRTYSVTVGIRAPAGGLAQEAYVKASNTGSGDGFGVVALSADGSTLVVGAPSEASSGTGVNGPQQADDSLIWAGAVYVFVRSGTTWSQQAYLKASNTGEGDEFGSSLALSADGNTLVVGAPLEASNGVGVNPAQGNDLKPASGAVYVFSRVGSTWTQSAYLKASNSNTDDTFGSSVALSGDGNTLAVGAPSESSDGTGVNGPRQSNNALASSGATYVFVRAATGWSQQAYVKPNLTRSGDYFGGAVALSFDGSLLAVGAALEDSSGSGIDSTLQANALAAESGAAFLFSRSGTTWTQQAYVKPSNTAASQAFGFALALSADGTRLAVGAPGEAGGGTGVNGPQGSTGLRNSGAVYVFNRSGSWSQEAYVKASNTGFGDNFGSKVSLSADGAVLAIGAIFEDSAGTGVNWPFPNESRTDAGAAYLLTRLGSTWSQLAYLKASNPTQQGLFGFSLALSSTGDRLVIGADGEGSNAVGVNGPQNSLALGSGAVYVFAR